MQQQQLAVLNHKLTDWQNEPTLQLLKGDLEAARPTHQGQVTKISMWNDLLNVTGKARPPKVKGRSSVQPKLVRRQAEWRYPALSEPLLSTKKPFSVEPQTFEDAKSAKQNELVLNHQFRTKMNRVKFVDDFIRSVVDEGTAIIQVGWIRNTVKLKRMVPVFQHLEIQAQEQIDQLQQAIELKTANPREYEEKLPPELKAAVDYFEETGQPSVAVQAGEQEEEYEKILLNHPTARVMNPANVIIDPSCEGDIGKAMFAVVQFETNKASLLLEGKRYKNLEYVDWSGAGPINEPDYETRTPGDFQLADAPRKKVVAYEYWGFWDITGTGKLEPVVCTWIGNIMIRMELNPFPDGKLPFVVVPYLPVKRELYGEPDAELLEDNQKIIGALVRGMIDLLGRSANSQQGFAKGWLDPLNRRRYENGQDYEFNPNQTPDVGTFSHKYPELPQSALFMLNLQNQDAESLTGVKSFSGGVSGESYGDVAAGIKGALDAAAKREMTILRRIAKGMVEIGEKFISMNAEFLSEEEVVRITNEVFEVVRREDLKGNFDLVVDISTAEIDNAKSQDLAFMLQTLGNTVDQALTLEILAQICELKRMPELAEKLRNFKPQPSEAQVKMQELELAKLEAEIEEIKSRAALNHAKAKAAEADAEQTELDAIEQGTGIKHQRDQEIQQGQAQGNKELAVTKALTTARKEGESEPDIEAAVGYNNLSDARPINTLAQPELAVDNYA